MRKWNFIFFLNSYFKEIIAIEQDFKASRCAKENLKSFKNIEVVNEDVLKYDFSKKCDLIVCEMLDTALIDEEEVPVLNHARNYLKENGKIIPQGIINTIELARLERITFIMMKMLTAKLYQNRLFMMKSIF